MRIDTLYCTINACRISEAKSSTCIESRTLSPNTDTCLCMLKQLDG